MYRCSILALLLVLLTACTKNLTERRQVYFNDFEQGDVRDIEISDRTGLVTANQVTTYANNKVLGPFNNGKYVQFTLDTLPIHNRLRIEFDLYIHDDWTGNQVPTGHSLPDYWVLEVDGSYPIVTTFSNINGLSQSFPDMYQPGVDPFPARGNSWQIGLPGACAPAVSNSGTTLYKVDLFHYHTNGLARISFTDQMRLELPLCNKSWSIDNVRVTAMEFH